MDRPSAEAAPGRIWFKIRQLTEKSRPRPRSLQTPLVGEQRNHTPHLLGGKKIFEKITQTIISAEIVKNICLIAPSKSCFPPVEPEPWGRKPRVEGREPEPPSRKAPGLSERRFIGGWTQCSREPLETRETGFLALDSRPSTLDSIAPAGAHSTASALFATLGHGRSFLKGVGCGRQPPNRLGHSGGYPRGGGSTARRGLFG